MLNSLDVEKLQECKNELKINPSLGEYKFRVKNEWVKGAYCRTTIKDFWAGGAEDTSRERAHVLESDEPVSLLGEDHGPNATEAFLHALGACLNASFIYHATAQGVKVEKLEFEIEGELDINGFLGVDENVPSNFQQIRIKCTVKADAPREKLEELCEYAQKRSPVFNSVSRPVPIDVTLESRAVTAGAHAG